MRRIGSRRGSVYFLCERSSSDPRYARYPRLLVLRCAGFEPARIEGGGRGDLGSNG
jgi:hypothetical protein